jgi:opacity protein-like surface antigen
MRSQFIPRMIAAALFAVAVIPTYSQTNPAAVQGSLPIAVGFGFSDFSADYGPGTLMGGTLWIDYTPTRLPQILEGIGIEAEGRDLSLNRSSSQPPNLREDVASGGVIYSWRRHDNFRPYGKVLFGFGNIDYESFGSSVRRHDSRTVTTLGGGLEYRSFRNIWVRGDFEYQRWPDFWKNSTPAGSLNPYGFTIGASYDFGTIQPR